MPDGTGQFLDDGVFLVVVVDIEVIALFHWAELVVEPAAEIDVPVGE